MVCWMADDATLEPPRLRRQAHHPTTRARRRTRLPPRRQHPAPRQERNGVELNELGRVTLRTQQPLLLDEYSRNSATGSFILIDPDTNVTVGRRAWSATPRRPPPALPPRTPCATSRW